MIENKFCVRLFSCNVKGYLKIIGVKINNIKVV